MDYLVSFAPNIVDVLKIGRSNEGRSLKVVRLSSGKNKNKPAIWIDAGLLRVPILSSNPSDVQIPDLYSFHMGPN